MQNYLTKSVERNKQENEEMEGNDATFEVELDSYMIFTSVPGKLLVKEKKINKYIEDEEENVCILF